MCIVYAVFNIIVTDDLFHFAKFMTDEILKYVCNITLKR
jgi:hypothetical protein